MMKVTLTQPSPNQVTASGSQAIPDRALKKPAIGSTTGESLRRSPTKIPSPTARGTLITRETTTRPKLAPMLIQSDPSLSIAHAVLATSPGEGRKIAGSTPARERARRRATRVSSLHHPPPCDGCLLQRAEQEIVQSQPQGADDSHSQHDTRGKMKRLGVEDHEAQVVGAHQHLGCDQRSPSVR